MRLSRLIRCCSAVLLAASLLAAPVFPIAFAQPVGVSEAPASPLQWGAPLSVDDFSIGLYNYQFDPVRDGEPAVPQQLRAVDAGAPGLRLIQFMGPIQDRWLVAAEASGLRVLQYYAHYAYLVWGTSAQVAALNGQAPVRWSGLLQPAYKLNPGLPTTVSGPLENLAITFYNDGAVSNTLDALQAMGGQYIQHYAAQPDDAFYTALFALESARLPEAAALPTVWAIDYMSPRPGFDDENGDQIVAGNYNSPTSIPVGYYNWLTTKSVNGHNVRWADVDTGLDSTHPDITGRVTAYIAYAGAPTANTDSDGHGTHTAGAIFGDGRGGTGITDPNNFYWGTGMAPSSTLVVQNALMGTNWPPTGGWNILSRDTVLNGAIGSNNSWYTGAAGAQGYSAAAREHDLMVRDAVFTTTNVAEPIIMVFSAGNAGSGASTMTEPKEAKNLISVGNSMNYPRTGSDINGLASSSSRGPALDGRVLPNVVAPGSQTVSFRSTTTGASSCTTAVAGAGATRYAYCTGTSMAAPFVSGAAVLITDWWQQEGRGTPSAAMVKALLINGAVDMVGGSGINGNIPNNNQGWGRVNLSNVIRPGADAQYFDQTQLFTASGQQFALPPLVRADPARPVKVTLVWSDAAGGIGASPALVNNLNLTVVEGGNTYRGNVFTSGWSTTGGSADVLNNIENVFLQNPSGSIQITVDAANIAGDGVPYNGDTTDQDFALVIYNTQLAGDIGVLRGQATNAETSAPVATALVQATSSPTQTFATLTGASGLYTLTLPVGTYTVTAAATNYLTTTVTGISITTGTTVTQDLLLTGLPAPVVLGRTQSQVAGNSNGAIDPGETFAVQIGLQNTGVASAYAVTGTLALVSGQATLLQSTASYGDLAAGQSVTNTTPYQFQVDFAQACQQSLSFVFTATYNDNRSITQSFNIPIGSTVLGMTTTYTSTNVPRSIPDGDPTGVTSLITVTTSVDVGDLDVSIDNLTHTYVGDLAVQLVSPQGTIVQLMNRPGSGTYGSSGDNFVGTILDDAAATPIENIGTTGPFTGRWRPDQTLAAFNTQPLSGTWQLRVSDNISSDTGTLNGWSIAVRPLNRICEPYVVYGVAVASATMAQAGSIGQTITYTVALTNTGSVSDTYQLQLSGAQWPTSLSSSNVGPLAAGASTLVPVRVTVPLTAAHGLTDTALLTITSQGDSAVNATVQFTTTAVSSVVHGVAVASATMAQAGSAGQTITYTVPLTNTGNFTDAYQLQLSAYLWPTSLISTSVGPLAAGASALVPVQVTVPLTAAHGLTDTALLTITSQGDSAVNATVQFTTTAVAYRVYLPLVLK